MKNLKKLIPALCLLLISAMLLGTSTFAWFSMNNQVTATGMKVVAKAESGIVISNADTANWTDTASAKDTAVAEILATSTADLAAWYHSTSTNANDANAGQAADKYESVSNGETAKYYSENVFYIRSATKNAITDTNLKVKSVTVTGVSGSENLDKAIRVGIKLNDQDVLIFAPVAGATLSYKVDGTISVTAIDSSASGTTAINTVTGITEIPASDTGLTAKIFVWYEGEDAACISNNVTDSLDNLEVSVVFTTAEATTEQTT